MKSAITERGLVIRIKGAHYFVASGDQEVRCSVRGRFRIGRDPEEAMPVVGDEVEFRRGRRTDTHGPSGLIVSIGERRSIFARSNPLGKKKFRILGANLDYVILVFSVREPDINIRLLDRMLVAAGCGGMEPVICINKMDLVGRSDEIREDLASYGDIGYAVVFCSALSGEGLERLRGIMTGGTSIMVGPSGSGKTSIVAALEPGAELRIGSVSDRTGKGRHTTTHFELHPLAAGGYLGDSPGVREFGVWGVNKKTLGDYFPDFKQVTGHCRYAGCTHSHEPGCSVKEAVATGSIKHRRYESYLRILKDLPDDTDEQRR